MKIDKPFQRIGSVSNSHVGKEFELIAQGFFAGMGVPLKRKHSIEVGVGRVKKPRVFDLGCAEQRWLVECKSHRWTTGKNVPSAKITVWNEAMFYFSVAPKDYKKAMFVLKDIRVAGGESLASYYIRTFPHLIPDEVEFWEFDETSGTATRLQVPSALRGLNRTP